MIEFQFLIGWLQTLPANLYTRPQYTFQFLIGWLQTRGKFKIIHDLQFVSIPYRLATNLSVI